MLSRHPQKYSPAPAEQAVPYEPQISPLLDLSSIHYPTTSPLTSADWPQGLQKALYNQMHC